MKIIKLIKLIFDHYIFGNYATIQIWYEIIVHSN